MAVEIIYPADRAAWLQARNQDITASVAGALFAAHLYTTAYQIWAEKTGAIERDEAENAAMRRGRLLEPAAVQMLREERPEWTVEYRQDNAYFRDPDLRVGATPDAFVQRPETYGQGICQFKTSSEEAFRKYWIDPDTGDVEVPTWIAVQAIVEAKLTGATWASVAVMVVGRGIDMHVFDIPLHEAVWKALVVKAREFWELTDTGGHPPLEWDRDGSTVIDVYRSTQPKRVNLTGDLEADAIVGRFEGARADRRAAQKLEDVLRAQVIYALGNADEGETARFHIKAPERVRKDGATYRNIKIIPKEGKFDAY